MEDTSSRASGRHARRNGWRRWWLVLLLVVAVLLGGTYALTRPATGPQQPAAEVGGEPSANGTTPSAPGVTVKPSASRSASPTPSNRGPARSSSKKGVSVWDFAGLGPALTDVRASWYYNWSAGPSGNAGRSARFVPMMWGAKSVNQAELARAKAAGSVLLGFNEPDFSSQANMTVEQALDLWPQLQATGLRLGSPAVAVNAAKAGGWLDRFLTGARARGYRVDFVALHWYGSDFSDAAVGHLRGYLQAVYDRYHLPIWLTEYALIKFGPGGSTYPTDVQQAAFVTKSTAMMENLAYVERYAWFALPTPKDRQGTGLYRDGTSPTAAGRAYRAAG